MTQKLASPPQEPTGAFCPIGAETAVRLARPPTKDEHHERIEEAGGAKVDVHIGDDTGEDEKSAGRGQDPACDATAVPEEDADTEKQGD